MRKEKAPERVPFRVHKRTHKLFCGLNPREHLADLSASGLDLMSIDLLTLLEEPLVIVLAVGNEFLSELAVLDTLEDELHSLAGLLVNNLGASVVFAVLEQCWRWSSS